MKNELAQIRWEKLRPAHAKELRALLDQSFGLKGSDHYLEDFPIWNPEAPIPEDRRYQIGGWMGNRLVTSASLRIAGYRWNANDQTKIGMIGAVCTHPEFAGKGFAGEAIEFLLLEAMKRKLEVLVLWGSESSLYEKKRFRFGGKQIRVLLSALELPSPSHDFEFRRGWTPEILGMLFNRKTGVQYHADDSVWIAHHRNTEILTAWKNGTCAGFAAWNRGIDLENMIHEVEGEKDVKIALLHQLKKENSQLEFLAHPREVESLTGNKPVLHIEYLAQFRTLPNAIFSDAEMDAVWFSGFDAC